MKQDNPEGQYRYTYIAAGVFIAIVMMVLLNYQATYNLACGRWAAKAETADQSCIRNYIYDFQTLIAGVFAVAAAYVTVMQMQKSDKLAERRHKQQIFLAQRPEILAAERFHKTIIPLLSATENNIELMLRILDGSLKIKNEDIELRFLYTKSLQGVSQIDKILSSVNIEVTKHFDFAIEQQVQELQSLAKLVIKEATGHEKNIWTGKISFEHVVFKDDFDVKTEVPDIFLRSARMFTYQAGMLQHDLELWMSDIINDVS